MLYVGPVCHCTVIPLCCNAQRMVPREVCQCVWNLSPEDEDFHPEFNTCGVFLVFTLCGTYAFLLPLYITLTHAHTHIKTPLSSPLFLSLSIPLMRWAPGLDTAGPSPASGGSTSPGHPGPGCPALSTAPRWRALSWATRWPAAPLSRRTLLPWGRGAVCGARGWMMNSTVEMRCCFGIFMNTFSIYYTKDVKYKKIWVISIRYNESICKAPRWGVEWQASGCCRVAAISCVFTEGQIDPAWPLRNNLLLCPNSLIARE